MKKKRHILIVLLGFLVISVIALVAFVQSAKFAQIVRSVIAENLPEDWGIQGSFSNVGVNFFPPGISIALPEVTLSEDNILSLPAGSKVNAERIDFRFYPLQMLTGNVRIHEAAIVNGNVDLFIDPSKFESEEIKKDSKKLLGISWDDIFGIQAESFVFENTSVSLNWLDPKIQSKFVANYLKVSTTQFGELSGFLVEVELDEIEATYPESWLLPSDLTKASAKAIVTSQGVSIERIWVTRGSVEAAFNGELTGNLLNPEDLLLDAELELKGPLDQITSLISFDDLKTKFSGEVEFNGRVQANLVDFKKTFFGNGRILGKNVRVDAFRTDEVELEGEISLKKGEVALTRAVISAETTPREIEGVYGYGGKAEFSQLRFPIGSVDQILSGLSTTVKFTDAHVHWLVGPVAEALFPLDMRLNGTAKISVVPDREATTDLKWAIRSDVDFLIKDLIYDNQRIGRTRPLSRLLQVPQTQLLGSILINSKKTILGPDLELIVGQSLFNINGEIDYETGYDISVNGRTRLTDFGPLAERKLMGEGTLNVRIHNPNGGLVLDFNPVLTDASYLGLYLGDLTGRITYDDDPGFLYFKNIAVNKGVTQYICNGALDLNEKDNANLEFDIPKGDINDLIHVFRDLHQDLWWFPESLSGATSGKIFVNGPLNLDYLKITGDLKGEDWDFYGEKFQKVTLKGGFDGGRYYLSEASTVKRTGSAKGVISYDDENGIEWTLKTTGFTLRDFDFLATLDIPIQGDLRIVSSGKEFPSGVRSNTTVDVRRTVIKGRRVDPSDMQVTSDKGILGATGRINGRQGVFDLSYNFDPNQKSSIRIDLDNLDFSPVLLLLNPKLISDVALRGEVSGAIDLKFNSGAIEFGEGVARLDSYHLNREGAKFTLVDPINFRMSDGNFEIKNAKLRGPEGELILNLLSESANVKGSLVGQGDLAVLPFLTSAIESASGVANIEADISGNIREPLLFAKATLRNAQVRAESLDSPFENVTGEFQLRQNIIRVKWIESNLANGFLRGTGQIDLYANKAPLMDLRFRLSNNKLKVYPFQFVNVSGKLEITGDEIPYVVEGELFTNSALSREEFIGGGKETRQAAKYTPPQASFQRGSFPLFKLNIGVRSDRGILVKNRLFDSEVKGKITVVNTIQNPRILGEVDLIRGTISFKDHVFKIGSAKVVFDSPTVLNPKFNLDASTDVKGTKINLFVSGTMKEWKIELSSEPVLPEQEIINLLALGLTSEEFSRFRSGDAFIIQQGEAASLLLDSFGFNKDVKDKTGFDISITEATNPELGNSLFRPQSETDPSAAPKIVIKRRIGQRINVSVGSTVGAGTGSEQEGRLEVENVLPGMSVIGVWNKFEGTNVQDTQNSYGVDLKFEKRFD